MADPDFMEYRRVVLKSDQEPSIVALCDAVKNGWHGKGEPHDGHTAYLRLKGKPWRVELPSFGECVDHRKRTRRKLESRCVRGC